MKMTIKQMQAITTEMVKEVVEICKRNNINYFLHCGSALGAIRHQGPIPWDPDVDIVIPYNQLKGLCTAMHQELPEKFYLDFYDTNDSYPILFPRVGLRGYSTQTLHIDIFQLIGSSYDKNEQIRLHKKSKLLRYLFFFKNKANHKYDILYKKIIMNIILKIIFLPIKKSWILRKFENLCSKYPFETAEYVTNPNGHYGIKNVLKKSIYGKGTTAKYAGLNVIIPEQYDTYLKHYYGDYMKLPPERERNLKQTYFVGEI